jgi:CelD/BcsL family acetyltransferase involved in cellulose biosynthesis
MRRKSPNHIARPGMPDNTVTFVPGGRRAPSAPRVENRTRTVSDISQRAARTRPDGASDRDLPSSVSPPLSAELHHAESSPIDEISLCVYGELADIGPEWKAFERRADCTVFQTFDWVATWQKHVGTLTGTVPAIVFGRDRHGQLLFILPLAIERHRPFRRLAWLGSDLCDYNAPLLGENFSEQVSAERFARLWREVVGLLRADPRFRFDWIDLQKMPDTIGAQRNPFLDFNVAAHPSGAYVATLDGDWESYYTAKRSSQTRKKERKQLKHLAEHGEIRFVNTQDCADIERTLETLFTQKSRSFVRMGVDDLMARPGYQAFYRAIATDPGARDVMHVSRLDVGVTPAATSLGLKFRESYYLVLSSYDDGDLSRFGPGRAHLHELIRYSIESGLGRFDFTVGDEPYKRDWSDIELRLYDYLAAATIRGHLVAAGVTAFRRTKRFIKQTPILWRTFSKGRSFVASLRHR